MLAIADSPLTLPVTAKTKPLTDTTAVKQLLKLSVIARLPRRMIAIILGAETDATCFDTIIPPVMNQCLEGFVASRGGTIVHKTNFERHDSWESEIKPSHQMFTTDVCTLRIMNDGYIFIEFPDERVVVHLLLIHLEGGDTHRAIHIYSTGGTDVFFRDWCAYTRQNHYLRGRATFPDGEPIENSRRYRWDDVVLPDRVCTTLRTHVETFLAHAAQLRAAGVKGRRGLILSGPPGTGKTLVGKVLADTLGVTFIWVLPRHVQSQGCIAEMLKAARFLAPAVIFFEDLDLFGEDRNSSNSGVLGELMNQLDGVNENNGIVAIATTNRLEVVESALRNRPGRFDRVIELGLPDTKARRKLLQRLLGGAAESELTQLVTATDGYSPAHLEGVVNTMHLLAVESGDKVNGTGLAKITPELINRTVSEIGGQRKHAIGFGAKEFTERP